MKRGIVIAAIAILATAGQAQSLMAEWWRAVAVPSAAAVTLGGAVDLDGTEYFTDDAGATQIVEGATALTMGAWVYNADTNRNRAVFGNRSAGGSGHGAHLGGYITTASGWTNAAFAVYGGTDSGVVDSNHGGFTTGAWHLIVGTWTISNAPIIYVDNYPPTTGAVPAQVCSVPLTQRTTQRIGRDFVTAGNISAQIDNCFVYLRALTPAEIADLYNGGAARAITLTGTYPSTGTPMTNSLVSLYLLDDGLTNSSATTAVDTWRGTSAAGTGVGAGDWTNGIVPIN